jgi:CBS-domain-containing membrane protein
VSLRATDTLEHALRLFAKHCDVTYVPIVSTDDARRLVGMVCQNDELACREL